MLFKQALHTQAEVHVELVKKIARAITSRALRCIRVDATRQERDVKRSGRLGQAPQHTAVQAAPYRRPMDVPLRRTMATREIMFWRCRKGLNDSAFAEIGICGNRRTYRAVQAKKYFSQLSRAEIGHPSYSWLVSASLRRRVHGARTTAGSRMAIR